MGTGQSKVGLHLPHQMRDVRETAQPSWRPLGRPPHLSGPSLWASGSPSDQWGHLFPHVNNKRAPMSNAYTPVAPTVGFLPFVDDTCVREKSRRGHVARLGGVRHPSHPEAGAPKPQMFLLQLPDGRGGNGSNMGTLIFLINSLCSGVVAISPACSQSSSRSRKGSPRLLAHCLPNLCPVLALSPGRGGQRRGFL